MEIDMPDTCASLKRRHSVNKDKEAPTATDNKKQKQENEEKSEECVTVTHAKKEKQDNEEPSEECATVIDTEDQRQEKEETSEECETLIEAEKQKQDNEEKNEECEISIEIKQQKQENEETSEECTHVIDTETQKLDNKEASEECTGGIGVEDQRQENEETEEECETLIEAEKQKQDNEEKNEECEISIDIKQQKQENEETSEECATVIDAEDQRHENEETKEECTGAIGVEDQRQENEETEEESQETRSTEVDTQTDVYEFILNAREPTIQRLSTWTSNVDYQHQISNTWFTVDVTRPNEPAKNINVYNTNGNLEKYVIMEKFQGEFLYHGTDELSAKNIIEQGIDLSMSKRCADFSKGNGFYVTADYDNALEWSKRMVQRSGTRAAVIVFKFNRYTLNLGTHLSLTVDSDTDRKWWQCIVSHFRRDEKSPDIARVLRDVTCIEGPMAEYVQQAIPTPVKGRLITQLCIRDQDLANRIGKLENIKCVVFISL